MTDSKKKSDKAGMLTKRELEVLELLKHGKTSGQIAQVLNIKDRTVHYHAGNIRRKLGASNRANAVAIACSRGIIHMD